MSTTRIHKVWVHENDPMQPKPKPDIIINVKSFPNIEEVALPLNKFVGMA
jgi:hypothetical protein